MFSVLTHEVVPSAVTARTCRVITFSAFTVGTLNVVWKVAACAVCTWPLNSARQSTASAAARAASRGVENCWEVAVTLSWAPELTFWALTVTLHDTSGYALAD